MDKRVGVIGLGAMGGGMVSTLLTNGCIPTVFDVDPEAVSRLTEKGAKGAQSAQEVGANSEIVITSLPSPASFEETLTGDAGLLKGLEPGSYIIDTSTIDPGTTRRMHELAALRDIHTLDAPLSGGPHGAASGTLTIIVGGEKEHYEACLSLLNILGKSVIHVGPIGAGQTVKLCNNAAAAVHTVVMGEVLLTGVKAGVDLKTLVEAISSASGNCWILQNFFPKTVLAKNYDPPLFSLNLMVKDIGLYMKTTEDLGLPSIMAAMAHQVYSAAKAGGKGNEDHTGVVRVVEELADESIGTI